jgi:hypothetical protein
LIGSGDESSHIWRLPSSIVELFAKKGSPSGSSPDVSSTILLIDICWSVRVTCGVRNEVEEVKSPQVAQKS